MKRQHETLKSLSRSGCNKAFLHNMTAFQLSNQENTLWLQLVHWLCQRSKVSLINIHCHEAYLHIATGDI